MPQETASVITPIPQETSYEIGRDLGRMGRAWGFYDPPPNSDAYMLAGYDAGWAWQDQIYAEGLTELPATDHEARWELELEYAELMSER